MRERLHGWVEKAAPYKQWRYHWNHGAVHDVDQSEWRDGQPLCVLELTSNSVIDAYTQEAVAHRLWYQFTGRKLRQVAQALGVPFYVVLFITVEDKVTELSVCHLTQEDAPWRDMSPVQYRRWLSSLPYGASAAGADAGPTSR